MHILKIKGGWKMKPKQKFFAIMEELRELVNREASYGDIMIRIIYQYYHMTRQQGVAAVDKNQGSRYVKNICTSKD